MNKTASLLLLSLAGSMLLACGGKGDIQFNVQRVLAAGHYAFWPGQEGGRRYVAPRPRVRHEKRVRVAPDKRVRL